MTEYINFVFFLQNTANVRHSDITLLDWESDDALPDTWLNSNVGHFSKVGHCLIGKKSAYCLSLIFHKFWTSIFLNCSVGKKPPSVWVFAKAASFCEWCSNYHPAVRPCLLRDSWPDFAVNTSLTASFTANITLIWFNAKTPWIEDSGGSAKLCGMFEPFVSYCITFFCEWHCSGIVHAG